MPELNFDTTLKIIKAVELRLRSLQKLGLRMESGEKLLNQSIHELKNHRYEQAITAINELGTLLEKAKKISIDFSNHSLECQKNLKGAEAIRLDVTDNKELYNDAQELFKHEKFEEAIKSIKECSKRIKDDLFLFLTEEIKHLYKQFKQLPINVIQSHDIKKMFNDADLAVNKNDYASTWDLITQLKSIYKNVSRPILIKLEEQAKDNIIRYQDELESANKVGADLTDANEIFAELIERMRQAKDISDYKEVIEYTSAGKHALERAVRRKQRMEGKEKEVKGFLENIIQDLKYLRSHFAIPSSVEDLISNAKAKIDEGNFELAIEDIRLCDVKLNKLRNASDPKLILKIDDIFLKPNQWNRAKISISNHGLASAKFVNFKLSGPIEIRRMPVVEELGYNETKTFEIGLKINDIGSIPIDMDVYFDRTLDGKSYHEHQELWLDIKDTDQLSKQAQKPQVSTPLPIPHPKRLRTNSVINCVYCRKPIEQSTPIFKCDCGTIYHLECITNIQNCMLCDAPIKRQVNIVAPVVIPDKDDDEEIDWE